jgi:hypothetical protein
MLKEEISDFGLLIADEDGYECQGWAQRELELRQMYEELNPIPCEYREEEKLDRRERARDINSVSKCYYRGD